MYIMTRRQGWLAAVIVDCYPVRALHIQLIAEDAICSNVVSILQTCAHIEPSVVTQFGGTLHPAV